uniref:Cell proliferation regulating inhibitor of protein phosphatase 2A n=1 Tax=Astyanax mexicanus TaxID=7994 RepID=A0A8B9RGC6_ASTMX
MDVTTCLKSLLLAIRQYKNNKSTLSSSQLQKQIEDVSGLKCSRLLTSGQVLPSECLSGLLEVAGDPNTSHALTGAILSLLSQLASDDESKEALHSSYSIVGTLAAIVHWNRATPEESVVLQVKTPIVLPTNVHVTYSFTVRKISVDSLLILQVFPLSRNGEVCNFYCRYILTITCLTCITYINQLCSETVLKTLELMSKLKQQVPDMETRFYRILQDQRMVMPLSLALTSNRRECVQTALRILFEAAPLPDFPAVILGESIAANNAYRHREAERAVRGSTVQGDGVSFGKSFSRPSTGPSGPSGQNIDSLIEKLQSGIQLQEPMKDVHMSEIIDVYEQKISALASKEGRLQDLLEAKALALSQADRLIAQYRCQRAQAEAEARKLASLLKETERRKEELQAELSEQVLEVEKLKTDSHQLLQHNSRLQTVSDEHQNLKGTYNQLLSRYNKNEGMLKELQAAHISLTQQAEGLRKSNEGFKLQQERLSAELVQKEQHIATLEETVQEKRATIAGLQAEMRRQEEQASEMEESMNILRKELNKTEQARKEASIKVGGFLTQTNSLIRPKNILVRILLKLTFLTTILG